VDFTGEIRINLMEPEDPREVRMKMKEALKDKLEQSILNGR